MHFLDNFKKPEFIFFEIDSRFAPRVTGETVKHLDEEKPATPTESMERRGFMERIRMALSGILKQKSNTPEITPMNIGMKLDKMIQLKADPIEFEALLEYGIENEKLDGAHAKYYLLRAKHQGILTEDRFKAIVVKYSEGIPELRMLILN